MEELLPFLSDEMVQKYSVCGRARSQIVRVWLTKSVCIRRSGGSIGIRIKEFLTADKKRYVAATSALTCGHDVEARRILTRGMAILSVHGHSLAEPSVDFVVKKVSELPNDAHVRFEIDSGRFWWDLMMTEMKKREKDTRIDGRLYTLEDSNLVCLRLDKMDADGTSSDATTPPTLLAAGTTPPPVSQFSCDPTVRKRPTSSSSSSSSSSLWPGNSEFTPDFFDNASAAWEKNKKRKGCGTYAYKTQFDVEMDEYMDSIYEKYIRKHRRGVINVLSRVTKLLLKTHAVYHPKEKGTHYGRVVVCDDGDLADPKNDVTFVSVNRKSGEETSFIVPLGDVSNYKSHMSTIRAARKNKTLRTKAMYKLLQLANFN
jgi:hypothetical protein